MKILKITLIVISFLIAIGFVFYIYYGGLYKPVIQPAVQGGETVIYEEMSGDYGQSGMVMNKIYTSLKDHYKIETFKGFGLYFDNPQKVEKSKLRSEVGCIVEVADLGKIPATKGAFKSKVLPIKQYLVTEFPYKGQLSVVISLLKVYPALRHYAEQNGYGVNGSVMEVYDMPNGKILYRQEIVKK